MMTGRGQKGTSAMSVFLPFIHHTALDVHPGHIYEVEREREKGKMEWEKHVAWLILFNALHFRKT
jgi:hypothetical protein